MEQSSQQFRPQARHAELVIEHLPDEVLVYDLKRDKAHCLSHTAALVWKHCDGRNTVSELTELVQRELASPVAEDVVWFAVDQLDRSHLLQGKVARPATAQLSRRDLLRRAGTVAAAAVVTTIIAPTAAEAVTCLPNASACNSNTQCCSNFCSGSVCT